MKILCGEYDNPAVFTRQELKTIFNKTNPRTCDFPWVTTDFMDEFVHNFSWDTRVKGTGITREAPTGEPFVKICFYTDSIVKAEAIMVYLLIAYQSQSKKQGKQFLYWRSKPCFILEKKKVRGRCRLLFSKGFKAFKSVNERNF